MCMSHRSCDAARSPPHPKEWLVNLLKMRGSIDEVPDAAHPLFLLNVRATKAAGAEELRARMEHAPVVDDDGLESKVLMRGGGGAD
jgi:hypothetical protein